VVERRLDADRARRHLSSADPALGAAIVVYQQLSTKATATAMRLQDRSRTPRRHKRALPSPQALARHGEKWRPYRTVASRYLWRALDTPSI
jgi:3-methyladenine DNA glycosylase/8-oxoguanine DNA glycosylase